MKRFGSNAGGVIWICAILAAAALLGFSSPAFAIRFGHYGADGHFYQSVFVNAEAGAQCSMTRSGSQIAQFSIPDERSGFAPAHVVYIDVTQSKEDISVSCAQSGGPNQEAQVRWGKAEFFADSLCPESGTMKPCAAIHSFREQYVPTDVYVSAAAPK